MSPHLALDGCGWTAPGGAVILHPLHLALPRQAVLGIVGPNGAGKSTALRQIYRYLQPTAGPVLLDGADIWRMEPRAVGCRIAAVFQEQPTRFTLTVREIVALGRARHRRGLTRPGARDRAVIDAALDRLALSHMAERRIGTPSGGERQRALIARALTQEPELLVLDEPTNHLDIRHQLEALALIRDLGLIIVVGLHDLSLAARHCDQILLLDGGRALAQGPPEAAKSPAAISAAFDVTARQDGLALAGLPHLIFHLKP